MCAALDVWCVSSQPVVEQSFKRLSLMPNRGLIAAAKAPKSECPDLAPTKPSRLLICVQLFLMGEVGTIDPTICTASKKGQEGLSIDRMDRHTRMAGLNFLPSDSMEVCPAERQSQRSK